MRVVWLVKDTETGERAGAAGTFQVVSLRDDDDNELTDLVDQGRHYASIEALEKDLSAALDGEEVSIEEQ